MRYSFVSLFLVLIFFVGWGSSQVFGLENKAAFNEAYPAADKWLKKMDQNLFAECYRESSSLVHEKDTQDKWVNGLNATRALFGLMQTRSVLAHNYFPDGMDTVHGPVIQVIFTTEFKNCKPQLELVTLHREGGDWVPLGYGCTPKPEETATETPGLYVQQDDVVQNAVHLNKPPAKVTPAPVSAEKK